MLPEAEQMVQDVAGKGAAIPPHPHSVWTQGEVVGALITGVAALLCIIIPLVVKARRRRRMARLKADSDQHRRRAREGRDRA